MTEEIEAIGGGLRDNLTRTDGPRDAAKNRDWWYEGNVEKDGSITDRTKAFLRAYVRISGDGKLHAAGLLLDQGRVHMDKYVIRRLHADGYLKYVESAISPYFELTELGHSLIDEPVAKP